VHALRERIPNLVIPTARDERRKLAPAASVPPEFVERIAVAVKNTPALGGIGRTDPEQTRDLMSYADAYEPLADELEALASFVRHSVTAARNKAGGDALATYTVARRLSRLPQHAGLAPHVEDMRRLLGRRGPKPKAERQADPPPVVTPPVQ
jgi:hypothetical protein